MAERLWFVIIPVNNESKAIVNDTQNRELAVPVSFHSTVTNAIGVNFKDYFKPDCILSFGRDKDCSVICDAPNFSRRQCRFFLQNDTLMIRDDSSSLTTSICPTQFRSDKWYFSGSPRQRAVLEKGEWELKMGTAEFIVQFTNTEGNWWEDNIEEKRELAARKVPYDCMLTTPNIILPPTRYQTRVQTPHVPKSRIRDSGGIMAVKIIDVPRQREKETKESLKAEVQLLANLSHPHIIEYKHSQGWELGRPIEIFMSAADGSLGEHLERLRTSKKKMTKNQIALVSQHIMSALHYLHGKKIIHRDIKPENILYKDLLTDPIFILADFGFSKEIDSNTTFLGTPLYLAPEVCSGAQQDCRLDIWSFGVVIYEMLTGLDLGQLPGLARNVFLSGDWCKRLENACRGGGDLAKMVTLNVEERITTDSCYPSKTFPILPDTLPPPTAMVLALRRPTKRNDQVRFNPMRRPK